MSSSNEEVADQNQIQKAAEAVFVPTKSNHNFNTKVEGIFISHGNQIKRFLFTIFQYFFRI